MIADVEEWLLAGDPAIRWQTLRDLTGAPERTIARERARVAMEGWGAMLLERQGDGIWTGYYSPKWTSATYTLQLLRACGLPEGNRAAGKAALALLDAGLFRDDGINFWPSRRCSETCVTAMGLAIAARYARGDQRIERLVANLLGQQMPDGGWNCELWRGATHGSLHTTISTLEGLLEYETAGGAERDKTRAARERGHEFLYAHRLFRSHRTGAVVDERMTRFSFPPQWHYDVLRGLDYLAAAGAARDQRVREAIELVRKRRREGGTWPLQNVYSGKYHFRMERVGQPSRWNTLRALRALRWWEG